MRHEFGGGHYIATAEACSPTIRSGIPREYRRKVFGEIEWNAKEKWFPLRRPLVTRCCVKPPKMRQSDRSSVQRSSTTRRSRQKERFPITSVCARKNINLVGTHKSRRPVFPVVSFHLITRTHRFDLLALGLLCDLYTDARPRGFLLLRTLHGAYRCPCRPSFHSQSRNDRVPLRYA